ncbi:hypothetical protein FG427_000423 [Yersinia enterocolitica]|nr:hypothetical protein [Yersinia enterocolitica]EKN4818905.1 hypothetical protein [Yersinia enterocolitica]EKN4833063.1 hypothetical protein [Yersinia enterocolitica]
MNELYYKLCILISSIKKNDDEIIKLFNSLKSKTSSEFLDDVKLADVIVRKSFYKEKSNLRSVYVSESRSSNLAWKINDILIIKSNFSKKDASKLLIENLVRRHPDMKIPSYSKISFASWINKISKEIPESELLHAAHTVRNEHFKSTVIDWNLKD